MNELLVFCVLLAGVAVLFEYFIICRDRKADIENEDLQLYTEVCAARIGPRNWSIPFVRLTLYPAFVVVSYARKIILPYDTIDKIAIERYILGRGVRIYHHQLNTPERLIIWSSDIDGLYAKLSELVASSDSARRAYV